MKIEPKDNKSNFLTNEKGKGISKKNILGELERTNISEVFVAQNKENRRLKRPNETSRNVEKVCINLLKTLRWNIWNQFF